LSKRTGYLAAHGFRAELLEELGGEIEAEHGDLLVSPGPARKVAWARNVWLDPVVVPAPSIASAARALLGLGQRLWAPYACRLHRRTALIAALLPRLEIGPRVFGAPLPPRAPGSFALLERELLLCSPECTSPFPGGEVCFVEDHEDPPSRAYLKLWEALTLLAERPGPGDRCLDLGASPGAWSWALARLGARVLAVDKAPLAPRVARTPGVEFLRASAFSLEPERIGRVDWLFSDIVCYPARLLRLVERWLASGLATRLVCTVKLQGPTDAGAVRAFAALEGARLVHLHHNRHELTLLLSGSPR
jgi:23S rRNA (cytidine2498-2'-O)-methyltransferase